MFDLPFTFVCVVCLSVDISSREFVWEDREAMFGIVHYKVGRRLSFRNFPKKKSSEISYKKRKDLVHSGFAKKEVSQSNTK